MNEIIFLVEVCIEGGFTAKALGESIVTEADTIEDLKLAVKEAVHCHFDDNVNKPKLIRLHQVKDEVFAA